MVETVSVETVTVETVTVETVTIIITIENHLSLIIKIINLVQEVETEADTEASTTDIKLTFFDLFLFKLN